MITRTRWSTACSALALLASTGTHAQQPDSADVNAIPSSVQTNCLICHSTGAAHEPVNALAPPLFAVKNHLKEFTERQDFIEHVVAWIKAPDAAQARMPGAVKKFGLMPALAIDEADAQDIAAWLFDTPMDNPNWYAEHYRKEHGKEPGE